MESVPAFLQPLAAPIQAAGSQQAQLLERLPVSACMPQSLAPDGLCMRLAADKQHQVTAADASHS